MSKRYDKGYRVAPDNVMAIAASEWRRLTQNFTTLQIGSKVGGVQISVSPGSPIYFTLREFFARKGTVTLIATVDEEIDKPMLGQFAIELPPNVFRMIRVPGTAEGLVQLGLVLDQLMLDFTADELADTEPPTPLLQ